MIRQQLARDWYGTAGDVALYVATYEEWHDNGTVRWETTVQRPSGGWEVVAEWTSRPGFFHGDAAAALAYHDVAVEWARVAMPGHLHPDRGRRLSAYDTYGNSTTLDAAATLEVLRSQRDGAGADDSGAWCVWYDMRHRGAVVPWQAA